MTLTFWIAIYGAVVATASLVFNYLRDPQPYLVLTANNIAWGNPGMESWNVHIENKGDGIARNVRVRSRRGKGAKWSQPELISDLLKAPESQRSPLAWWSSALTDAEYRALADPKVRSSWKVRIIWQQGPVRLVGRRRMTISPSEYREPLLGMGSVLPDQH